jgi:hypothetical protein
VKRLERLEAPVVTQAIEAYREIAAPPEFKERKQG